MKIKRNLQQWRYSFALIILLLAFLACRTSSNEVIPTFDPNLIKTAIAGTSAAAQFQTLTANPTLTFTPESTSTLTPKPSLTPTPIELTDSLDSKCLSIDKKVALDQIFDESYFDGMITDVQGVCDQTDGIFQSLNAAKNYEVYFKIQSKSQEYSEGIFWIGEFRNSDINNIFDSSQELSPLNRQEISDLGNKAIYTCTVGFFGAGTVDSYRIHLDSYLIYLFFFHDRGTGGCNIETYLPGIRAMINDFRK